ncbi:MAG: hypothetical protein ACRC2K_10220 [Clostridium sp.]
MKLMIITFFITVIFNLIQMSLYLRRKTIKDLSIPIVSVLLLIPIAFLSFVYMFKSGIILYSLFGLIGMTYIPCMIYVHDNPPKETIYIFMFIVSLTSLSICINISIFNIIGIHTTDNFLLAEITRLLINFILTILFYRLYGNRMKNFVCSDNLNILPMVITASLFFILSHFFKYY